MSMKIILITGFEPFGGEVINPSWELAQRLDNLQIANYSVVSRQLSCAFDLAAEQLAEYLEEFQPVIVLNIGQAGGRQNISLEKVAINLIDARIADNLGNQPIDEVISQNGATAYFTNLPLKAISYELTQNGIPNAISYSAGSFVCNYVFYQLMELIERRNLAIQGGFIHIPYLPEQVVNLASQPSMGMETLLKGIELILKCIVSQPIELKISGGTIC